MKLKHYDETKWKTDDSQIVRAEWNLKLSYSRAPSGLWDLGRMVIYLQGVGEHWELFSGIWGAIS